MAMKKEDLRIGNLVNRLYRGETTVPDTVSGYDLWHSEIEDDPRHSVEWGSLSAIPLSGGWLRDFGFDKLRKRVWGKYGGAWYYQIEKHPGYPEGYVLFIDVDGVSAPPSVVIKYVHQLQNLYFALTGEELTIKEK